MGNGRAVLFFFLFGGLGLFFPLCEREQDTSYWGRYTGLGCGWNPIRLDSCECVANCHRFWDKGAEITPKTFIQSCATVYCR